MNKTVNTHEATLHSGDSDAGPVAGQLFVGRSLLQFQSETVSTEIALQNLEAEFDESGRGIFFGDTLRPGLKIFTWDQSILRHPAIRTNASVASLTGRRELSRALRLTLYFAVGCLLAVWLGSLAMSAMARAIAARVPIEWERKLGDEKIAELRSSGQFLNDTNQVAKLTALAAPLIQVLPASRRDLKFFIMDDADPNACALPGGYVIVNSGLLKLTDQPEELLGVLAHELSHETKRHAIRGIIAGAGPLVIFGLLLHSNSGLGNLVSMGSGLMVYQGFSQAYETEADDTGWDYLVAANIDPRGFIHAFQKLEAADGDPGMHSAALQAFQSHPAIEKRIARLEKKWDKLPRKTDFLKIEPVQWDVK